MSVQPMTREDQIRVILRQALVTANLGIIASKMTVAVTSPREYSVELEWSYPEAAFVIARAIFEWHANMSILPVNIDISPSVVTVTY